MQNEECRMEERGGEVDDLFEGFPRLDKTKLTITTIDDQDDNLDYWLSRPPEERWLQIEFLRRIAYGTDATARLQRVVRITERKRR